MVEAWGDDVPDGTAWPKIMEDKRMKPDREKMPFDGQRMFWGGFKPLLDEH